DEQRLKLAWVSYPEPGTYRGPALRIENADSARASFVAPKVDAPRTIHLVLMVTDNGSPPLTRYQRVIVTVKPKGGGRRAGQPPSSSGRTTPSPAIGIGRCDRSGTVVPGSMPRRWNAVASTSLGETGVSRTSAARASVRPTRLPLPMPPPAYTWQ